MKKLIFLATLSFLCARENPFVPSDVNTTNLQSSNIIANAEFYKTQFIKFPSDARELQKVVFFYKTSSGEIKQKELEVGASFDWRDEFVLKVQENSSKTASAKFDVSVTTAPSVKVDQNAQLISTQTPPLEPKIEPPLKSAVLGKRIKFDIYKNKINIFTKDKKIRDFATDIPNKVAIDFSKNDKDFVTKNIDIDVGELKKITFGSHDKFYRAVFSFKKAHKYEIKEISGGFELILK